MYKSALDLPTFNEPVGGTYKSKVGKVFGGLTVIKYAGKDSQGKSSYFCSCECGTIVVRSTGNLRKNSNVKYSCGCLMNSEKKLTLVEMEKTVTSVFPYPIVQSDANWTSFWSFNCPNHGLFKARYSSVKNGKSVCPECRRYGFKGNRTALFYINVLIKDNRLVCYKYGITQQKLEIRLSQIVRGTDYSIYNLLNVHLGGDDAVELEKLFKRSLKSNYLNRHDIPSGFTETVSPDQIIQMALLLQYIQGNFHAYYT